MTANFLDTKGLKCPLPVLRARKALKSVEPGALLEVHATDPSSVQDFQSFCDTAGHALLATGEENGVFIFKIRKSP